MPSNHEALNGDVISLIVGQAVEWGSALRACYAVLPELLDQFRRWVNGVVWKVEKDMLTLSFSLL